MAAILKRFTIAAAISAMTLIGFTQVVPAQENFSIALKDAKIVTQPGHVIEKGTIVVRNGLIEAVGADVKAPFDAKVIDCEGLVIYAGFFDSGTTKGIPDGEASGRKTGSGIDRRDIDLATQIAASTRQVNRKGIYPDYSSTRFVSISDKDAKDWRNSGFTTVHIMPSGELLNGTTSVVLLTDPNKTATRDSILQDDFASAGGWRSSGRGYPTSMMGSVAHLRQSFLDGQHYQKSWEIYRKNQRGLKRPPRDSALAAIGELLDGKRPVVFPASRIDEVYRARSLGQEFGLTVLLDGIEHGYEFVDDLKSSNNPVILRINFAKKPELGKRGSGRRRGFGGRSFGGGAEPKVDKRIPVAKGILEDRTEIWTQQVSNPATLASENIEFVFSTAGHENMDEFVKHLRLAIENGLSIDDALTALTTRPARLFGLQDQLGTVESGKIANLVVMNDDIEQEKAKVFYTLVNGTVFEQKALKEKKAKDKDGSDGDEAAKDKDEKKGGESSKKSDDDSKQSDDESETPNTDKSSVAEGSDEKKSSRRKRGKKDEEKIILADWPITTDKMRVPKTKTNGNVLIKNATVITASNGTLGNTSILITDGKIQAIGNILEAPRGHTVVDGTGAWVMPGIIDCHSHMVAGGNEGSLSVTPEVRAADTMRTEDLTVYRAAAGGVTAANVLHGSANTIGGQRIVIQMKYKANPKDMLFKDFAPGVKFALGENVIRNTNRYPNSRMGVESVLRHAFEGARQYRSDWQQYNGLSDEEKARTIPPRRDLRLETLQKILNNEILIHCHCYNAGEILMLLKTLSKYGIEHLTLEHGLEAYKIAPEIRGFGKNGAHLSTFADFWGYKVEAYDAVPYNVALINESGGVAILNSDSGERVRRLNHDAAKMVRWGGLSYQDAIRTITLNPAIALRLDDRVGSIEVGKKADLALFNGHPLNTFSRNFMTLIDGEVVFEREGERGGPYPLDEKKGIQASAPEASENGVYAIQNASIFPGGSAPIQKGTLVIRDGKIAAVGGQEVPIPEGARIVDGSNLHVYPGMIDGGSTVANSDLGLSDAAENGTIKPDLKAAAALKPDTPLIGIARFTGATCSITTPSGGLISGQSALIQYDGWNFDDLAVVPQLALEMSLPSKEIGGASGGRGFGRGRRPGRPGGQTATEEPEAPKPTLSPYDTVMELFADARRYDNIKVESKKRGLRDPDLDNQLEALIPFVRKEKPVVVRVRSATDILDAIDFAKEADIKLILRDSGTESWKVADKIAEAGVPILIGPITSSVSNNYEPYDTVFRIPARLHEAGVLFAFHSSSNTSARDMPLSAGLAVAYGLPEDEAVAALTSNTAKIFGIGDMVGTLGVGKRADIIVTDSSPLQATSNVIHMFINGKPIDVDDNLHTELYKKYQKRLKNQSGPQTP